MLHLIKDMKPKQRKINHRSTPFFLSVAVMLTALFTLHSTPAAEVTSFRKGTVNAATLNVRARPGTNFEVVAKLQKGATVQIVSQTDEWYEIIAPSSSAAWCAAHLLADDNTVAEDGLRVRSGPGIVFSAYHRLEKGAKINKKDKRVNGWQSIQPPANATVWVSRQFVDAEEPALASDTETTMPTAAEKTAAFPQDETPETETDAEEAPPAGDDNTVAETNDAEHDDFSADAEDQGTEFGLDAKEDAGKGDHEGVWETAHKTEPPPPLQEGVVIPLKEKETPFATHILANVKGKKAYPKAYLRSSRIDLTPWEYKSVKVHGKKVQYDGWSRPVFIVRGIERLLE